MFKIVCIIYSDIFPFIKIFLLLDPFIFSRPTTRCYKNKSYIWRIWRVSIKTFFKISISFSLNIFISTEFPAWIAIWNPWSCIIWLNPTIPTRSLRIIISREINSSYFFVRWIDQFRKKTDKRDLEEIFSLRIQFSISLALISKIFIGCKIIN